VRFATTVTVMLLATSLLVGAGWDEPNRSLQLVGDAALVGDVIQLTPSTNDQAGAAWILPRQRVADGFVAGFTFRITNVSGDGADGLAFVIQNSAPDALGGRGPGMGYGIATDYGDAGIANSLAIEFDTSQDVDLGDPNDNQISIHTVGTFENNPDESYSIGTSGSHPLPNFSDGSVHTVLIIYSGNRMAVHLDGDRQHHLNAFVNLSTILKLHNGEAWVGFTGSTGSSWENHDILSFRFRPSS
jgi:Legume lectin domain